MAQRNCSTSGCGGGGCGGGGGGGAMRPPASSSSLSSSIDPQQPKPEVGGGWNALGNGGNGAIKPRGRRRLQLQQEAAAATAAKEKKKSKGGDGRGSSTKTKYSHSSILLMVIVSLWILSVVSMVVAPSSQGLLTYLHWIKWPLFRDLNDLVSFRLPHARNIRVHTSDGMILGGWHLLPAHKDAAEASQHEHGTAEREEAFDRLMGQENARIVIFFHGNAATRGQYNRVELSKALSSTLGAHVIIIDYRGFADSTGWPTEEGLLLDAQAVWQWVQERTIGGGTNSTASVYIYGHSLGSGVAVRLASHLNERGLDGQGPTGIILDAPFTNLSSAALYHPSALPFRIIPFVGNLLLRCMLESYPSFNLIQDINYPILILHGRRDRRIPFHLGMELYQAAMLARLRNRPHLLEDVWFSEFTAAGHNDVYAHPQWIYDVHHFMGTMETK